jgi:hypothetical protein
VFIPQSQERKSGDKVIPKGCYQRAIDVDAIAIDF